LGETPQLFPVLWGLWAFYVVRAEFKTARELGEQLLHLAQSVQDSALLLQAHHAMWTTLVYIGEFTLVQAHLKQGIALYNPQQHHSHVFLYGGHDPGVCCKINVALSLWLLGYPDQALRRSHEAVTLAQELSHPHTLAWALNGTAMFHNLRREREATQEQAEAAITLSTEQGFALWVAMGTILRGWAQAEQGQREEGIAQMRQGLATLRATGTEMWWPHFLALLAETHGKEGQTEEGLNLLTEALAAVHRTGERIYEAELYRLKGTLTLQSKTSLGQVSDKSQASQDMSEVPNTQHLAPSPREAAEAEAFFLKAIEIARKQQAKSLELRAVMSLSRLWHSQGKKDAGRKMLAEIYGWFTEGFDTKDLQEAKALLEELH
jgi:predicted ATPase